MPNPLPTLALDAAQEARGRASAVINAARKLAPSSIALGLGDAAEELDAALAAAEQVTAQALGRAARLARDDQGQPDGLAAEWDELRASHAIGMTAARRRARDAADRLQRGLLAKALPAPGDPSAQLLARQDIELRLAVADKMRVGEEALALAQDGNPEIAAQLASEWGRAYLKRAGAGDASHEAVVTALVTHAAEQGNEAAAAFAAFDGVGQAERAIEEAEGHAGRWLKPGWHGRNERGADRARHDDLREAASGSAAA